MQKLYGYFIGQQKYWKYLRIVCETYKWYSFIYIEYNQHKTLMEWHHVTSCSIIAIKWRDLKEKLIRLFVLKRASKCWQIYSIKDMQMCSRSGIWQAESATSADVSHRLLSAPCHRFLSLSFDRQSARQGSANLHNLATMLDEANLRCNGDGNNDGNGCCDGPQLVCHKYG